MLNKPPRGSRLICLVAGIISLLWFIFPALPSKVMRQRTYLFAFSILFFIAIMIAVITLAKKLNRNATIWCFACLFLPGLLIVLAFLDRASSPFRFKSSYTPMSYTMNKTCSQCGRSVSLISRAGQHCPHCGAYWSFERK